MGVVIPSGYGQASLKFSLTGDPEVMVCTLGFNAWPDLDEHDAAEHAAEIRTSWLSEFAAASYGGAWTFVGVDVTINDGGNTLIASAGPPVVGTAGTSHTSPQNTALLVKKVTGFANPKNRGRFYMPAYTLEEGSISNAGVVDAALVTAIQTDLTNFYDNLVDASPFEIVPVLLHSNPADTPTTITGFELQNVIATQRRRLRK